jgi:ketosteroid isomerase-like protein
MQFLPLVFLALILLQQPASASDACGKELIATTADVTVSDGSAFRTESYYQSKSSAAIRHLDDGDRLVAVEGPFGWARSEEEAELGPDFYKLFALGHQYHALLLEFDDIVDNVRQASNIEFGGELREARSGDYPYGGTVHLVQGEDASRPAGLRFDFPGNTVILAAFLDWREQDGMSLPRHVRIDDGERTFDYRYTSIAVTSGSPLRFFEAVPAPSLDKLLIYRLHRRLLAAHCIGDAEMIASLSAPTVHSVNRGRMEETPNADLQARFASLFDALDYTGYRDLADPVVDVAGNVGWIAVNTRATGTEKSSGQDFDDQWAWIMTVRRIDGEWRHAANASNRLQ